MMTCSVEDCIADATARGLCQKHYMRQRRHGSPTAVHKRGRKPADPMSITGFVKNLFQDISPRTRARYIRAMTLDHKMRELLGVDLDLKGALMTVTRANDSVNFARLLRIMETRARLVIAQLPEDDQQ